MEGTSQQQGRSHRTRSAFLLVVGAVAMAGCQMADRPIGPHEVFFPQPPPRVGPSILLLAISHGTLVLEDGCLWLDSGGARALVIWPPSYRLVARAGRLTVVDGSGAHVASVGEKIQLGGGALRAGDGPVDINVWVESVIGEPVPPACRLGNYWDAAGRAA